MYVLVGFGGLGSSGGMVEDWLVCDVVVYLWYCVVYISRGALLLCFWVAILMGENMGS